MLYGWLELLFQDLLNRPAFSRRETESVWLHDGYAQWLQTGKGRRHP